jgi:uncharacterized protein (TIGR02391 family)
MPKRASAPEPPIEIRRFTPEEAERAVTKLRRRIEECEGLRSLRYDDERVYNAASKISDTILDVFGQNSPEYGRHRYHHIKHTTVINASESANQKWFQEGLVSTLTMLAGLVEVIQERVADDQQDRASHFRLAFEGLELHPRIAGACGDLFRDGHYRNAVLDASLALENFVKEKSRLHDLTGAPLMRTAFSKNTPVLVFNDLRDQSDADEQEGLMHLFEGVMLALRNPRAHSLIQDSPEQALDYIALLDLLARRLDQAKRS